MDTAAGGCAQLTCGALRSSPYFHTETLPGTFSLRSIFQNVGSHHTGLLACDGHQLSRWPGCSLPHCQSSASVRVWGAPRSQRTAQVQAASRGRASSTRLRPAPAEAGSLLSTREWDQIRELKKCTDAQPHPRTLWFNWCHEAQASTQKMS